MAEFNDVCYTHGTFFVIPINNEFTSDDGYRGIVSVDADGYDALKAAGLMDSRVKVTMVVADNDLVNEEGWTGEAGLRTIRVHNVDPKPQLMLAEGDIKDIIDHGIVDGVYCDLTISKLA